MEIDQELREILNPAKSALLVWDVQNMLVQNAFNADVFLSNTRKVIETARKCGIPVIFSKITPLPAGFESRVRNYFFRRRQSAAKQIPNGFELALEPAPQDVVIPKNTASMFVGTNFELLMRNAGLTTLIITGIATEIGVESTARDAGNRGFFPVVVSDAVSSSNEQAHYRSLKNMKGLTIQLSTSEIVAFWDSVK